MSTPRLKIGSKGTAVTRVQQALLDGGYDLPKWGVDGELGWETWVALMSFAEDRGLSDRWPAAESGKGEIPGAILEALSPEPPADLPPRLVDLTRLHPLVKGRKQPRKPAEITGIVLHQTAVRLGNRHSRWYNVACHLGITPSGEMLHVNDLLAYVWHANRANAFTLGVEIDGCYEGVEGQRRTLWGWKSGRTPDVLSAKQIRAARDGVRWLVEAGASLGCPITEIYAHRQFSAMRRSDPGSAIWHEVGLWAQEELGLVNPREETLDDGLPIPFEWDPRASHDYLGRKRTRRRTTENAGVS